MRHKKRKRESYKKVICDRSVFEEGEKVYYEAENYEEIIIIYNRKKIKQYLENGYYTIYKVDQNGERIAIITQEGAPAAI